jgi:hypothetical protein
LSINPIIRAYQAGDEKGITELLLKVFQNWPPFDLPVSVLDHWKWKYLENPYGSSITVALDGNQIIGCDHSYFQRIKMGNEVYLCGTGADVAVDSTYRSKGIFNQMRKLKTSNTQKIGVKYQLDSTTNPILIKSNIREGFPPFPFEVIDFYKIYDVDHLIRNRPIQNPILLKYGFLSLSLLNEIKNKLYIMASKSKVNFNEIEFKEIQLFPDEMSIFWNNVKEQYNFINEINTNYLNWRYCNINGGKYIIYLAIKNNDILGYIVLRINKINKMEYVGYIIDLITLSNLTNLADRLIGKAIEYFEKEKINIITYVGLRNSQYNKYLRNYNFIGFKPIKFVFKFFPNMETINMLKNSKNTQIQLNAGFLDTI